MGKGSCAWQESLLAAEQAGSRAGIDHKLAGHVADPDDLDALAAYYPKRFALQNLDSAGDGARVQDLRAQLDFPAAAAAFQLIQEHRSSRRSRALLPASRGPS